MSYQIPREHWYQIIDVFTRIDELLETLIKQNNEIINLLRSIQVQPSIGGEPIIVRRKRANTYKVYVLDLTTARSDEPLGLMEEGITASSMTILRVDAPFQIKINSRSHEGIDASVGASWTDWEIHEVYISNDAADPLYVPGGGTKNKYGVIYIEWGD